METITKEMKTRALEELVSERARANADRAERERLEAETAAARDALRDAAMVEIEGIAVESAAELVKVEAAAADAQSHIIATAKAIAAYRAATRRHSDLVGRAYQAAERGGVKETLQLPYPADWQHAMRCAWAMIRTELPAAGVTAADIVQWMVRP